MRPIAALLALGLTGLSPFQSEERNVREGNERLLAGDPSDALRRYGAAEKAVGPRAEIDYDRGNALHRLGRSAEAREAWRRALERADGSLSSRALQNIGTALAAEGDREGAVAAFTDSLRRDPGNEDARFDLEVLLRKRQEGGTRPRQPDQAQGKAGPRPQQGGPPPPDPGQDGRQAGAPPPPAEREGKPEPPPDAQRQAEQRQAEAGAPRPGPAPEAGEDEGGAPRAALSRQDAERLLDALRARERNMPLGGRERREGRRADVAKDW